MCCNINIIMENDVFRATQDYKETVDKVNDNIRLLKSELVSLRKNDLRLMRQLIHINDVIQSCYQRFTTYRRDNIVNITKVITCDKTALPLVRQQSVPSYCVAMKRESSVCSSFEGIDEVPEDESLASDDNDSIFSASDCVSFSQRQIIRPRSMSYDITEGANDLADDIQLENILLRNVEIWKHSNTNRSDTPFLPSKSSIALT